MNNALIFLTPHLRALLLDKFSSEPQRRCRDENANLQPRIVNKTHAPIVEAAFEILGLFNPGQCCDSIE